MAALVAAPPARSGSVAAARGAAIGDVVVVRSNGADGGRFRLDGDASIGRAAECDIRVRLPSVSRQHAKLFVHGGAAWLAPTSASSVTTLNGSRIGGGGGACATAVRLAHGDTFEIGNRSFRFEYGACPPRAWRARRRRRRAWLRGALGLTGVRACECR